MDIDSPSLDCLADVDLSCLTQTDIANVDHELYALYGIALTYENFGDFELGIYQPGDQDQIARIRWPIPALRTVREVHELCERMHAATIKP